MGFWKTFVLGVASLVHGLFGGANDGITTFSPNDTTFTTPLVFDSTTLAKLSSESNTPISPKFLSTLSTNDIHLTSQAGENNKETTETTLVTVTGISAATEFSSSISPDSTTKQPETTTENSPTTGETTTHSGKPTASPTGEATTTSHVGDTSTPTPTEKPKLSRGAVAGIVIGCLLLIAVVAAAVVFFVKNRNAPPEAQRLRV